jgi:NAD(P)-dependent dehydrogenase (short-subunit alcohol dehydrogenase family)
VSPTWIVSSTAIIGMDSRIRRGKRGLWHFVSEDSTTIRRMDASGSLAGRRALVVGVETPAGTAIARAVGAAGAALGLATMRADEGVLIARRIQRQRQAEGGVAAVYAFDVTLGQNVKVSTRQVAKELGGLDVLVSAPDRFVPASLGETTDSDLAAVMVANCYAHLFAVRAAVDEFRRGGGGRVILVTHEAGIKGLPGASAYAAAHAATVGLARSLAAELRDRGIALDTVIVGRAGWTGEGTGRTLHPTLDEDGADALGRLAVELLSGAPGETGRVVRLSEWTADGRMAEEPSA